MTIKINDDLDVTIRFTENEKERINMFKEKINALQEDNLNERGAKIKKFLNKIMDEKGMEYTNELVSNIMSTDTMIMLSATPHDGRAKSFASLMNMLDPTAIANPNDYTKEDIRGLWVKIAAIAAAVAAIVPTGWASFLGLI